MSNEEEEERVREEGELMGVGERLGQGAPTPAKSPLERSSRDGRAGYPPGRGRESCAVPQRQPDARPQRTGWPDRHPQGRPSNPPRSLRQRT